MVDLDFRKLSVTVAESSCWNAEPVQEGGVEVAHRLIGKPASKFNQAFSIVHQLKAHLPLNFQSDKRSQ